MHRWELGGRFEYADTREQAAALFGATDPNEVRFAGYCGRPAFSPEARSGARLRLVRWQAEQRA